jgi:hypothetical protein
MILHTFSIYIIYPPMQICIVSYSLLMGSTNQSLILISINMIMSFIFLVFFTCLAIKQIFEINILSEIGQHKNMRLSLHYDRYFSVNYDLLLLVSKFLICFESTVIWVGYNNRAIKLFPASMNAFINILILVFVLLFTFNLIIKVIHSHYSDKTSNIVYLINPFINNFRIFLLVLTSLSLIFLFYTIDDFFSLPVSFIIFSLLLILGVSIYVTFFIADKNKKNIYMAATNKFIYTFIYLYTYRHLEGGKSNEILKFSIYHCLHCKNKEECVVCNQGGFKNFNFEEVIKIGDKYLKKLKVLKNSQNSESYIFTQNEIEMLKFMKLIIFEELEGDRTVMLIHKTKKRIHKERNDSKISRRLFGNNFNYNLCFFYDYLLTRITNSSNNVNKLNSHSNDKSSLDTFIWFSRVNSTSLLLEHSADKMLRLYDAVIIKDRREIFSFIGEMNEYKEEIMESLLYLFAENHKIQNNCFSFTSNYSLESLKYIYDSLFNPLLENPVLEVRTYEDSLEYMAGCFEQEKLINICFNYNQRELKLIRTNKELNSFKNKKLEDLFPSQISKEGKELFIDKILNTTSNQFTFEYYMTRRNSDSATISRDKYLNVIKMDCLVCFSFDLTEFLIIAKYEIVKEDILMVNNDRRDGIVNFSEGVGNFLYLTVHVLDYMTKSDNYFCLKDIFKKSRTRMSFNHLNFHDVNNSLKTLNNQIDLIGKPPLPIYEFDLKQYYKYYMHFIKIILKEFQDENFEDKVLISHINNFTRKIIDGSILEGNFKNQDEKKEYSINYQNSQNQISENFFSFTLQIKNTIKNFTFYKIAEDFQTSTETEGIKKIRETFCVTNHIDTDIQKLQAENLLNENTITNASSINSFTSADKAKKYSRNFGQDKHVLPNVNSAGKNIFRTDEKNNNYLKSLTRYLIIASFFIIVYCIAFMIIGFINNQKMNQVLTIKNNYASVERYFFHIVSSVVNNIIVHGKKKLNTETSSYLLKAEEYFSNLDKTPGVNIKVQDLLIYEISVNLDFFKLILDNFMSTYYTSSYSYEVDSFMNQSQELYSISRIGSDIQVLPGDPTLNFIEALKIYMNNIREIISINNDSWIYLKILSFKNYIADFSNFYFFAGVETISRTQILMYELLINYVNMQKGLLNTVQNINEFYVKTIDHVFLITIILSLILLCTHLFLLFIGIKLIGHFKRILRHSEKMTNELICGNMASFKYMKSKFEALRIMSFLYRESPLKIVRNIKQSRKAFVKSENEKINKRNQKLGILFKNKKEEESRLEIRQDSYTCGDSNYYYINRNCDSRLDDKKIYYVKIGKHTSSFSKLICYIFTIYLIYSFISLTIILGVQTAIELANQYSTSNNILFNNIVNNFNLLQVSIYTNRTDSDLNYEMMYPMGNNSLKIIEKMKTSVNNTEPEGLIFNLNKKLLYEIKALKNYRKFGGIFDYVFQFRTGINCKNLYALKDSIYNKISEIDTKHNLTLVNIETSLTAICEKYNLLNFHDVTLLEENSLYIMNDLLSKIDSCNGDYNKLSVLSVSSDFYDLLNVIILVLRPFYTSINIHILPSITKNIFDTFLMFMIIYLSLNIFVDFLIIIILYFYVIRKIEISNREINNFVNIIKYM